MRRDTRVRFWTALGLTLALSAPSAAETTAAEDLFPESVIESVALRSFEPEDAISDRPDLSCSAIRRKLSRPSVERMERWRDLGLLDGSACTEIGERDPLADWTTSERLARRYPPLTFELGGLWTFRYERYPLRSYASADLLDPLGWSGR